MAQKNPGYATRYEFKMLKKQVKTARGVQAKIKSFETKLQNLLDNQKMIINDIKALDIRVERMRKRLVNSTIRNRRKK